MQVPRRSFLVGQHTAVAEKNAETPWIAAQDGLYPYSGFVLYRKQR
jgi:hypothetical protein